MPLNLQRPTWAQSPGHFIDQLSWIRLRTLGSVYYRLAQHGFLGRPKEHLCRRCFMIAFVYRRAKPKHLDFRAECSYQNYDDLVSQKDCAFCKFIVQQLGGVVDGAPVEKREWFSLHILSARDTCYLGVYAGDERPEITASVGWARGVFDLKDKHHRQLELMGSGETVAVDFVKKWLAECEADHQHGASGTQHRPIAESRIAQRASIFLIDVVQKKLVRADSSARYVALSYVWGPRGTTVDNFETTKATLDQLLVSLTAVSGIPIVVLDAIQFVAAVGERYLWVDRLCIVQDDAANKHENISQMDIIYSRAVFTIVAASGTSGDVPLPGVRSGTRAPQVSPQAGGVRLKRGSQGRDFALLQSHWNTRGWTFQEMHLSPRRVIFTAHEVMCECADRALAELDLGEVLLDPNVGNDPLLYLVSHPTHPLTTRFEEVLGPDGQVQRRYSAFGTALLAYRSLVRVYARRQLSYDSDILNALAGILSHLASRTGDGFVFGLPAGELGLALLWLADDDGPRRTLSGEGGGPIVHIPSWSWIGWRTPIFWLPPIEQMDPRDKRWTYEDRIAEYRLVREASPHELRTLPRNGELYPPSLGIPDLHNLLCFEAEVLPATRFSITELGPQLNHLGPIKVLDAEGVYCGSMFLTSLGFRTLDAAALDFVALSTFEFSNTYGKAVDWDDVENGPPMFLRNKSDLGNGKMMNGLLVRELSDGVYERVAVFRIDSEVWDAGAAVLRTVYLG